MAHDPKAGDSAVALGPGESPFEEPDWDDITCEVCPCFEEFEFDVNCEECKKKHPSGDGLCRGKLPVLGDDGRGHWPVTHASEWCAAGRDRVMAMFYSVPGSGDKGDGGEEG